MCFRLFIFLILLIEDRILVFDIFKAFEEKFRNWGSDGDILETGLLYLFFDFHFFEHFGGEFVDLKGSERVNIFFIGTETLVDFQSGESTSGLDVAESLD